MDLSQDDAIRLDLHSSTSKACRRVAYNSVGMDKGPSTIGDTGCRSRL